MSITFGKTRADNFGRVFEKNPRLLTRNPFLNYLRFYKKQHPKYGLNRILRQGSRAWRNLTTLEKQQYTQKQVLSNNVDVVQPLFKRRSTARSAHILPISRIPMNYKKRSLDAYKNIRHSWNNAKRLPRYGKKKLPPHLALPPFTDTNQETDDSYNKDYGIYDVDEESVKDLYFIDFIPFH